MRVSIIILELANSSSNKSTIIIAVVVTIVIIALVTTVTIVAFILWRRRQKNLRHKREKVQSEELELAAEKRTKYVIYVVGT